jgi:hypothetical protein
MSNAITENLVKVRELLSDKSRWTQRTFARDSNGWSTDVDSGNAVSWCLVGAMEKVAGRGNFISIEKMRSRVRASVPDLANYGYSLSMFNDTQPHANVLALLDRAIDAWGQDAT